MGCHAQVVQFPSNALSPELRQASLAISLAGFPMASRVASQAPSSSYGVLDLRCFPLRWYNFPRLPVIQRRGSCATSNASDSTEGGSRLLLWIRKTFGPTRSNSRNTEAAQEGPRTRMFSSLFQGGR